MWLAWVVASTVGGFLVGTANVFGLLFFGALFALPHWPLLRAQRLSAARTWVQLSFLAVVLGVGAAALFAHLFVGTQGQKEPKLIMVPDIWLGNDLFWAISSLPAGAVIGFVQAFSLRLNARGGLLWALVSALAVAGFWLVNDFVLAWQKPWGDEPSPPLIVVTPLSGAAGGLTYGAITGLALVWLLRERARTAAAKGSVTDTGGD